MKTFLVRSRGHSAARNLAKEEALLAIPLPGIVLYLWQNSPTVVIGAHQNPWTECDLPFLKSAGISLVRRRTGGGAVYHDLGTLNFSFVAPEALHDEKRELRIVSSALSTFGSKVEFSGRNDLVCNGRKICGTAARFSKGRWLFHGCILLNTDLQMLARVLTPCAEKLAKQGVPSVRARVANLFPPETSNAVALASSAIAKEFKKEFGTPSRISLKSAQKILKYTERNTAVYRSEDWTLGEWQSSEPAQLHARARFDWGVCEVAADFSADGCISSIRIASDAMNGETAPLLEKAFTGWHPSQTPPAIPKAKDIARLLRKS